MVNKTRRKPVFFSPVLFDKLNYSRKHGHYGSWENFGQKWLDYIQSDFLVKKSAMVKAMLVKAYKDHPDFKDLPNLDSILGVFYSTLVTESPDTLFNWVEMETMKDDPNPTDFFNRNAIRGASE